MNESQCITDLSKFEHARAQWLLSHKGSLDGFTTQHGALLAKQVEGNESIRAHLMLPGYIEALVLTDSNRLVLGEALNVQVKDSVTVTPEHIAMARDFVSGLYGVSLEPVEVIVAPPHVMVSSAQGATYSNASTHVVVVPSSSYDPMCVLVSQYAIAAHYTLMREKGTLASMMTDNLTQAMAAHYAVLSFAAALPGEIQPIKHLTHLVSWEFAKGLSKTPEMPMGFIVSDLGAQLMKAYGGGLFRAVMQDLYESMSHGQAIWFGCNNFNGMALALALRGEDEGMRRFLRIDSGDRKLVDKLLEAFPGIDVDAVKEFQGLFNRNLACVLGESNRVAA